MMATFLFDRIIFGPVKSRRLGVSLGINLLPSDRKWCSFNCIYCECGWTGEGPWFPEGFPSRELVREELEKKLAEMNKNGIQPDTITFAGNGEPTLHPGFGQIIGDTLEIRDRLAPGAAVAVLSNGTMLDDHAVFNALRLVDQNILKIDSAVPATFRALNQPGEGFTLGRLVENIGRFNGKFILQTLFVRGVFKGKEIDNATGEELGAWLQLVGRLAPEMVMVYTIARATPSSGLHRIPLAELREIALKVRKLGIPVQVSA
jgi:wyosine [tRNA(Phe)-imidazoG37] synthetase (radical SAM superfamily)